jgi:cation:H+ antiporter
MSHLGLPLQLLIFLVSALATWVAGVWLAKATDVLDERLGFGEAIGGMILLSVSGSLPEVAITITAATSGHLGIAAGNLIGGVAIQTLVLVIADGFVRGPLPLSTAAASLVPAVEGLLVVCVVGITTMSGLLPKSAAVGPLGFGSIAILVAWIFGMLFLGRCRDRKDMTLLVPVNAPATPASVSESRAETGGLARASTATCIAIFAAA